MPKHTENMQHTAPTTKRQRARHEQERLKQRRVMIAVISVLSAVVALVAVGLLLDKVIVPGRTVAEVNGVEISNREYQEYRQITQAQRAIGAYSQAQQFAQFQQQSGDQFGPQIIADIAALKVESQPVDYAILDQMIADNVIVASTGAEGLIVSDEEVQASLVTKFAPAIADTQPTAVPATEPLTGTSSITATTAVSPTVVPTLTAAESQTKLDIALQAYYGQLKEFIEKNTTYGTATLPFTGATLKNFVLAQERIQLLRSKVGEKLVTEDQASKEVYADADQIFISVTAAPTDTAEISATLWTAGRAKIDALANELEGGADFETVLAAKSEYKEDPNQPLGLRPLTEYAQFQITDPISTQPIGVVGEPYRSSQGWHLIRVKQRELKSSQTDLDQKRGEAIASWVTEKRTAATIKRFPEPTPTPAPPTLEPLPGADVPVPTP